MWEFACGNTFGGTALSSYGGFWLSYAIILTPSVSTVSFRSRVELLFVKPCVIGNDGRNVLLMGVPQFNVIPAYGTNKVMLENALGFYRAYSFPSRVSPREKTSISDTALIALLHAFQI